ncbi:hypothetical protein LUZ60_001310 [Juncus effusus]|nr:hypothetical protein LUZ60_001310 [Juncus effusus]
MDPSEPALKPQWLKSQNTNLSGNGISNPNSNAVSCRNRLTSIFSEKDNKLSKSKAYSSFGTRSNRNRNRTRKQEKDSDSFEKDSNSNLLLDRFDSLLSIPSEKDKLRRSRSFTSTPSTDNNNNIKLPEKSNKINSQNSQNGFLSKKDFPLLKTNGVLETGKRVSSPMERIQFAQNGGEWNSVLAEVPFTASPAGSNGSNGLSKKEAVTGLNMAKAVAQAPLHDQSTTQVTIDPQKIEELTIKQCKQLIPVTPTVPKNLVASSTEKLKAKGLRSLAPITVSKPASQLGTFQVLNRDKNGTVSPSFSSSANGTFSKPSNPNPNPLTPTNNSKGKNGVSKQAKARLEFFNFLRSKAASENPSDSQNGSDDCHINGKLGNGNDEVADKWDPQSDEDMCLDPEEEAFLRSLGWDANAEVDALTKEEIDAFNSKYKEKMQFSMVSQQKILSMS